MFDYYRFRFGLLKDWHPELGYELVAPVGILGVALVILLAYLTSPEFGLLMWRAPAPGPVKFAFGLVGTLVAAAYFADHLKRTGLWLVAGICTLGLVGTVAGSMAFADRMGRRLIVPAMAEQPSPYLIGAAFGVYLLVVLGLTVSRLRGSYGH